MKIDVSSQNVYVNGEPVKEIEILYADLLRNEKEIKKKKPEKAPLVAYHLKGGGKWEFETKIIISEDEL